MRWLLSGGSRDWFISAVIGAYSNMEAHEKAFDHVFSVRYSLQPTAAHQVDATA